MDEGKKIRRLAEEFILYKKSLGYQYDSEQYYLKKYVDYAEKVCCNLAWPEKAITPKYMESLAERQGTLCGTITTLREFSRYLVNKGYRDAYVVPPKSGRKPVAEPPYFFTEEEIDTFFRELDKVELHVSFKGRELVLPAVFRLLYCCGLRCKEARTLKCLDVHADELYIDIFQSKGPKSRRIFISEELAGYLKGYDSKISVLFPYREYYFPHGDGCYTGCLISKNFRRFWKKAYPDFELGTHPRAYDLRHHFAWANLNRWAAEGLDINVMLAYLMRYMGHQSVSETLYYFRFVPEFFPVFRGMTENLEDILPEVPDEE